MQIPPRIKTKLDQFRVAHPELKSYSDEQLFQMLQAAMQQQSANTAFPDDVAIDCISTR
ncbi:MAG: hypothetical protein BECKG1743D_GA0114223_100777 [Candidatus Kentron sp. G]|nr:MAG: hypothetical protein BECKG1743F_GA0114225_100538 [Candidatus Kentron sp. G]VFM96601.1 MAG: hypothetical protein BECKG1743E_GA0114224_100707 [Candidatus Kentron sp. G]VFM98675.1 MAG: hypothetical protein BECKG1743D_GA0114223_100777 [Candidatus Kentron sp. G]